MQRVYSKGGSSLTAGHSRQGTSNGPCAAASSAQPAKKPLQPPRRDDSFSTAATPQSQRTGANTLEYVVRVPKQSGSRSYHAMKFNANLNIDVSQWTKVNMVRENNLKEFKIEDDLPKFGAGSEFGKDARMEARRRKYGRAAKKYSAEDQPWLMKVGGKGGKKFKGLREGGVTENASYYVFMQGHDGIFEAYPLKHWYNFTPIQRFKALTAEEAEEEFGRRNKIMNYFSVMVKKKLQTDAEEGEGAQEEGEDKKKKKGGKKGKAESKSSALKISEMDEWIDSDDESDSDSDEEGKEKKKKKGEEEDGDEGNKKKKGAKKDEKEAGSEAEEESDDGDEEGRELDYISDSSASEEELETKMQEKGVDEEEAIRTILDSDEDEDEEEKKDEDKEGDDKDKDAKEERKEDGKPFPNSNGSGDSAVKKKKDLKKKVKKEGVSSNNSGESSDISESEIDFESSVFLKGKHSNSASECNSRSSSPPAASEQSGRGEKRKGDELSVGQQIAKKIKADAGEKPAAPAVNLPPAVLQAATEAGITEEGVTRYLMRKPMTAKELLQKFKSKKTGISSDNLVIIIAQILQRLNLEKRKVRDALYFSIKN